MVEAEKKGLSYRWWLDSHNRVKRSRSSWFQSTLSELDEKTKIMLKLIEEEADSFAQRAEIYYNKRPEVIGMVENFYRAHRSLAERYDQVKSESGTHLLTARSSPLPFTKHHLVNAYDSNSVAYQPQDSDDSEVDNQEEEEETGQDHIVSQIEEASSGSCNEELMRLREEFKRLKEENKVQKEQLMQKDEEKRDVIRQLSLAMDLLKEENLKLGQGIAEKNLKKESLKLNRLTGVFFGRFFNGFDNL